MTKEITQSEFNEIVERWGQCRRDHPEYMYMLDKNNYLTWTDIGSDIRHVYEKYGEWLLSGSLQDEYIDFDDYFWMDAQNRLVSIKEIILCRIEYEDKIFNKEGFANVLTSKVVKSIAYGATWPQMRTYINKEIDKATGRFENEKRAIRNTF